MTKNTVRYLVGYFFLFCIGSTYSHAFAEDKKLTLEELSPLVESKNLAINELKVGLDELSDSIAAQESEKNSTGIEIKKMELQVKKLEMLSSDKESFEVKNEIIGLNYEIRSNRKKLDELNESLLRSEHTRTKYNIRLAELEEELKILELRRSVLLQKHAVRQAKINAEEKQSAQKRKAAKEKAAALDKERILSAKRKALLQQDDNPESKPLSDIQKTTPSAVKNPSEVKNIEIELEQAKLLDEAKSMRPAAAALNRSKARALSRQVKNPLLGDHVALAFSQPVGSKPVILGEMVHLGNNQYMIEVPVKKGRQEFIAGSYHFFKLIPDHYDGAVCLVLIDLQNEEEPNFQLFVVD